jgi:hypothetical protein
VQQTLVAGLQLAKRLLVSVSRSAGLQVLSLCEKGVEYVEERQTCWQVVFGSTMRFSVRDLELFSIFLILFQLGSPA